MLSALPQCVKLGRHSGCAALSILRHSTRHRCGIPDRGSCDALTGPVTGQWQRKILTFCWCDGVLSRTDRVSGCAVGTWISFMERLFYRLAPCAWCSCGSPLPAPSGRRSPWTPRGESGGLLDEGSVICLKDVGVFLDHDAQPSILTRVKTSLLVTLWPAEWTVREWYNDKETPGWTPGISFNLKGFLGSDCNRLWLVTVQRHKCFLSSDKTWRMFLTCPEKRRSVRREVMKRHIHLLILRN